MAALKCTVTTGSVAITASTAETILQITAPTNQRLKITRWSVSADGASSVQLPIGIQVVRQTSPGTMTASPPSPRLVDKGLGETPQAAVTWKATAEPTAGDILDDRFMPAYNGTLDVILPYGQEITVPGGGRVGWYVVPAAVNINVKVTVWWEE